MSGHLSRRKFLGVTAGAGMVLGAHSRVRPGGLGAAADPPAPSIVKIHKVFLAKPVPTWPKPNLDIPAEMAFLDKHMAAAEKQLGDVKFVGGELLRVAADVQKLLAAPDDSDGFLVFNLTSTVSHLLAPIVEAGRPVVLFSQPYSGHDWGSVAPLQKAGKKVIVLATSDYGEIAEAGRILRVGPKLRQSRILAVTGGSVSEDTVKKFKEKLGVDVVSVDGTRLGDAYKAVDARAAEEEADLWIRGAVKVIEPTREDIVKSSRLFLAMKSLLEKERAQAFTINCLGLFRQGSLPAYPCLGFCRLNDIGLVGACEADLESTVTMLVFGHAYGIPGFISDPVIDTATNTVIHAHCVSPTKMDGPAGPAAPYFVRSHLEDNKGACLQVKMRLGEPITTAKLFNLDTLLISTGKILDAPDSDRGCRTKITTQVTSARKMLENYSGGLHRVIFYGDRLQGMKHLAVFMGWKVVEEI